jgi:putative heme-binding domain-containing protein
MEIRWVIRVCAFAVSIGLAFAQHGYTPADVEEGEALFNANCSICHGTEGDAVPGVDLGHGRFRRATSDEELVQIIRNGIPGTAMPSGNFRDHQLTTIVAYLRSIAESAGATVSNSGDAARGKMIFEGKGGCLKCHRVRGNGSFLGPELTAIGINRRSAQLERSILEPDAEILPQNRSFRVVTRDGMTVTGLLLNQDMLTIQLLDSTEHLRSFSKTNLKGFAFIDKSPMPSYQGRLSPQDVGDVVSYLATLKGIRAQ